MNTSLLSIWVLFDNNSSFHSAQVFNYTYKFHWGITVLLASLLNVHNTWQRGNPLMTSLEKRLGYFKREARSVEQTKRQKIKARIDADF